MSEELKPTTVETSQAMPLVERLRSTPNWMRESFGSWKDCVLKYDRAPFEAADEIERIREHLGCTGSDGRDADPVEVIEMIRGWEADAQVRAELLEKHLRLVLEVARTWQPDYATKMDRDTLQFAEDCADRKAARSTPMAGGEAVCEVCGGAGEVFEHADSCDDDLCALNGDQHSCVGRIVRCTCVPSAAADFECEDCIGMREHGCYCKAMGATQPGGPAPSVEPALAEDVLASMRARLAEQAYNEGCACRWDADDKRVATCARHQGWLEVVAEWADRAREAEAKLAAHQKCDNAGPLADRCRVALECVPPSPFRDCLARLLADLQRPPHQEPGWVRCRVCGTPDMVDRCRHEAAPKEPKP